MKLKLLYLKSEIIYGLHHFFCVICKVLSDEYTRLYFRIEAEQKARKKAEKE